MERRIAPLPVLLAGLLLGFLGYLFFYSHSIGLSLLIYTVLLIATTGILAWRNGSPVLNLRRSWVLIPILFFAAMFALRADETLLAINFLAICGLLALWIHHLPRREYLDENSTLQHIFTGVAVGFASLVFALTELLVLGRWLKGREWGSFQKFIPVLRGLALTLPILLVFTLLLSSADLVFANQLERIFSIFSLDSIDTLFEAAFVTAILAWGITGFLSYAVTAPSPTMDYQPTEEIQETATDPSEKAKNRTGFIRLGMVESSMVMVSVVLLFAVFVLIQFAYLFGGQSLIGENLTYADYARRGFFELVAISVMTLALMLFLDKNTTRTSPRDTLFFRGMSSFLVLLTLVLLASAWRRMALYETAYGFTHLRVYTHIFMLWLGILLGFGLLAVYRIRPNIFSLGVLIVIIGYAVTLNLLNVDYYIASRNVERFQQGEDLDMCYLITLSADALPAMLELKPLLTDSEDSKTLSNWLGQELSQEKLRRETYQPLLEWHSSYDSLWTALQNFDAVYQPSEQCWYYGRY